jgi:hypothetical protein
VNGLVHPPKEATKTDMRLVNMDRGPELCQGVLKFSMVPCTASTSMCGYLEEKKNITSVLQPGSSGKKRWAVLVNGSLHLFSHHGDLKEKHTLSISRAQEVNFPKAEQFQLIEIVEQHDGKRWTFLPDVADTTKEWMVKLTATRMAVSSTRFAHMHVPDPGQMSGDK